MPQLDTFALNSTLNAFLFARVGTEANGSDLTILSLLARLGKDPWAESALWAKLPMDAAIDLLASDIGSMELCHGSAESAHVTASRLVELLPKQSLPGGKKESSAGEGPRTSAHEQRWMLLCLVTFVILVSSTAYQSAHETPRPNTTATAQMAHVNAPPSDGRLGNQ